MSMSTLESPGTPIGSYCFSRRTLGGIDIGVETPGFLEVEAPTPCLLFFRGFISHWLHLAGPGTLHSPLCLPFCCLGISEYRPNTQAHPRLVPHPLSCWYLSSTKRSFAWVPFWTVHLGSPPCTQETKMTCVPKLAL